jgi:hypothetical protein
MEMTNEAKETESQVNDATYSRPCAACLAVEQSKRVRKLLPYFYSWMKYTKCFNFRVVAYDHTVHNILIDFVL